MCYNYYDRKDVFYGDNKYTELEKLCGIFMALPHTSIDMPNSNIRRLPIMKLIYSLRLARYLIDKGFYCHNVVPSPHKPWFNAYEFEKTPELQEAIKEYLKKEEKLHGNQ